MAPHVIAKTVLIADDTAFVRERFCAALTDAGHRAILAGTANEVLARVGEHGERLDLMVIDLQLPHARGIELVRAIRQAVSRVPVLIFSGTIANHAEVRQLTELGVIGFINEYTAPPHILPALAPHLFPDSFNRRSSPRVALSISVSYRVDQVIASALCANISKGGILLRTMNPQPAGKHVRVRFRMPGSKREIDTEAVVAWSDARAGMGLQFLALQPVEQAELDAFIDRSFFSNRKA